MSKVFVLDTHKQPLNPVHPARARMLLSSGKAAVFRRYPFTIILKQRISHPRVHLLRVKIDPGSKTTGIAIVSDTEVVFAAELSHRGHAIKEALDRRRAIRRGRRQRHTRYRKPRFQNRVRPNGWIPPSLRSRVENIITWIQRIIRSAPISDMSVELVKFDTQLLQNPDISGVEYQQGTLAGYDIREYLLEKWNRQCAYCGKKDIPLQIEHIQPKTNGGTNRMSNLTLSCEACNVKKGTLPVEHFLKSQPDVLRSIQSQAKAPLKDAAAVNASRYALLEQLKTLGLPVECGSGGLTKFNRTSKGLPKAHWIDAACVGRSTPEELSLDHISPLLVQATGRQSRQMCRMDRYGFPRTSAKVQRVIRGLQTGDMVRAIVPSGKKAGVYTGRVAVRASGSINIQTKYAVVQGISYRYCVTLHRNDGYSYQKGEAVLLPPAKAEGLRITEF